MCICLHILLVNDREKLTSHAPEGCGGKARASNGVTVNPKRNALTFTDNFYNGLWSLEHIQCLPCNMYLLMLRNTLI